MKWNNLLSFLLPEELYPKIGEALGFSDARFGWTALFSLKHGLKHKVIELRMIRSLLYFCMLTILQGERGPPGLPGGLDEEWPERIVTLKVIYIQSNQINMNSSIFFLMEV